MRVALLLLVGVAAACHPATQQTVDMRPGSAAVLVGSELPTGANWGPPPPGLPAGARAAVIDGDPSRAQLFTSRFWMPAGYIVPPHWHPKWEHLTVLSGTIHLGMGDRVDMAGAHTMGAGAFRALRANERHFLHAVTESIIQIHGEGPFAITYVNAADDPRRR